jgi:hypothetical protein
MGNFPPGGWDLEDCEDFGDWSKEIASVPKSKTLREVVVGLRELSLKLVRVCEPIQFDDEHEEENPPHEPAIVPDPTPALRSGRARPKATAKAEEEETEPAAAPTPEPPKIIRSRPRAAAKASDVFIPNDEVVSL